MKKTIITSTIILCLSLFIVAGASADNAHIYRVGNNGIYHNHAMVSGYTGQSNWANAEVGIGAWATGGNKNSAIYKGCDTGFRTSDIRGHAKTSGGTITGAYSTGDFSIAGGLTANRANSNLYNTDCGRTTVRGAGRLDSATYATNTNRSSGGSAATYATSGFKYKTSGPHHAKGNGIAGNGGVSKVTVTPNSVKATSISGSFAHSQSSGY